MSTVNDLMVYLNSRFQISLPIIPLPTLLSGLKSLWTATLSNWSSGETVPTTVTIVVPENTYIELSGGKLPITSATINLSNSVPNTD